MTQTISCPRCDKPVDILARTCRHCGVDLAIAAVVAERKVRETAPLLTGVPLTPEMLVPRLGEYLVEKGRLSTDQLQNALEYQAQENAKGRKIRIGQALRELDLVTTEILEEAVTVQILRLQNALKRSNQELEARVQERTQALEQALEKLTELNQLKANFIANVSHELRTPLTHLKGYLDMLHGGDLGALTEDQSQAIQVMARAEQRLERLIEDLIQFSLAYHGDLTVHLAPVRLEVLATQVMDRAQIKASARCVRLNADLVGGYPPVFADEEKIIWVIDQLLDNAIKFNRQDGWVTLGVQNKDRFVTITVSDSGIGIPFERIKEVFEPFHQLDSSPTRRQGGTGIGLALCQRILQAHGSQLSVKSIVGKGSQFEFSLRPAQEQ